MPRCDGARARIRRRRRRIAAAASALDAAARPAPMADRRRQGRALPRCATASQASRASGAAALLPGRPASATSTRCCRASAVLCLADDESDRLAQLAAVLAVGSRAPSGPRAHAAPCARACPKPVRDAIIACRRLDRRRRRASTPCSTTAARRSASRSPAALARASGPIVGVAAFEPGETALAARAPGGRARGEREHGGRRRQREPDDLALRTMLIWCVDARGRGAGVRCAARRVETIVAHSSRRRARKR